jgi:hypothetical protein
MKQRHFTQHDADDEMISGEKRLDALFSRCLITGE